MPTLLQYALGVVLFAHGWVHLVFVASSRGWLGPDPGWQWNRRSWLLSGVLDERTILDVATVLFLLVALGFTAGAIGYVLSQSWWVTIVVAAAALSALLYVTLWDGHRTRLLEQGALGVLLDLVIIAWALLLY